MQHVAQYSTGTSIRPIKRQLKFLCRTSVEIDEKLCIPEKSPLFQLLIACFYVF